MAGSARGSPSQEAIAGGVESHLCCLLIQEVRVSMVKPSISEMYAIASAIALLILVLVNNPVAMLVVSVAGLAGGVFVARQGKVWRLAMVAMAGFAAVLALALVSLWR